MQITYFMMNYISDNSTMKWAKFVKKIKNYTNRDYPVINYYCRKYFNHKNSMNADIAMVAMY